MARTRQEQATLILFGLLSVGLVLMLLKDLGWLSTPHRVSTGIAVFCLLLSVSGLVLMARRTEPRQPARKRQPRTAPPGITQPT